MDTDQLISHSRARFEHEAARRTLREKYQAKTTFAYRGGMWRAGPDLNCAIFTCGRIGEVVLEEAVYVGTGAKIINQLTIGKNTTIGAGAVVSKSLPENCTAVGIPAKPIKFHS